MLDTSDELIIGNNCCGGNFYQKKGIYYNNPFIWMVLPYDSMANLMLHFEEINWDNIDMLKSNIKKNTFILKIDELVEIHYVHHLFNPNYNTPKVIKEPNGGSSLVYNHIWEYIYNKYVERKEDMLKTNMKPKFIIHDQVWGNNKYNILDLIKLPCKYKRCFVTTKNVSFDYDKSNTKIISCRTRTEPEPMINTYYKTINEFFK